MILIIGMYSSDMQYYYNNGLKPLFDEIFKKVDLANDELAKGYVAIALFAFCRNTMALIELINKDNCTDSFVATLRLLMEISADVEFVSKNISNLNRLANGVMDINKRIYAGDLSIAEAAKMANDLRLKNPDGSNSDTTKRVKKAYNDVRFNNLYTYYCCYSHFNVAATIWTATRKQLGGDAVVKHSLYIFSFYSDIFYKLIQAIGVIIEDSELKKYDRERVDKVVKWLIDSNKNT